MQSEADAGRRNRSERKRRRARVRSAIIGITKMKYKPNGKDFAKTGKSALICISVLGALSLSIFFIFPEQKVVPFDIPAAKNERPKIRAEFNTPLSDKPAAVRHGDEGLTLYRQPYYRLAVEDFYISETNNRDITLAILEFADKNDIPLSLAFSLAYTESRYNIRAVNYNTNSSIDRGLFQLNDRSFPHLGEKDFFNPAVSARYGMAHLRFCLNIAGNIIPALAMYNAGANRVRANSTPQSTLNYIGNIMTHKQMIDKRFAEEVMAYIDYNNPLDANVSVAMGGKR